DCHALARAGAAVAVGDSHGIAAGLSNQDGTSGVAIGPEVSAVVASIQHRAVTRADDEPVACCDDRTWWLVQRYHKRLRRTAASLIVMHHHHVAPRSHADRLRCLAIRPLIYLIAPGIECDRITRTELR